MKIGDMVVLSSAGKKNSQNESVLGKIGMIVEINKTAYPYQIKWYGQGIVYGGRNGLLPCKRYEIKLLKAKK